MCLQFQDCVLHCTALACFDLTGLKWVICRFVLIHLSFIELFTCLALFRLSVILEDRQLSSVLGLLDSLMVDIQQSIILGLPIDLLFISLGRIITTKSSHGRIIDVCKRMARLSMAIRITLVIEATT